MLAAQTYAIYHKNENIKKNNNKQQRHIILQRKLCANKNLFMQFYIKIFAIIIQPVVKLVLSTCLMF